MPAPAAVVAEEWYGQDPPYTYLRGQRLPAGAQQQRSHASQGLRELCRSVFMPQGFPESVSPDYVEYQTWDSVQAFCSYSTNTISTKAMLSGMGVGDDAATASAALVTWLLKDGAGMLGRIVFAWAKGKDLDNNSKQWRLVADACDDAARIVGLLAPAWPEHFTTIMCIQQLMYAVVGVGGGATRNAVTQHQARANNSGDVSAKDGSQETMVTLLGLGLGLYVTPMLDGHIALTWAIMLVGSVLHIYANYRAVRSLQFTTFNLRRASVAIGTTLSAGPGTLASALPTPAEMALLEPIFPALRFGRPALSIALGERIGDLAETAEGVAALVVAGAKAQSNHLIGGGGTRLVVVVQRQASQGELLAALFHAEVVLHVITKTPEELCDGLRKIKAQCKTEIGVSPLASQVRFMLRLMDLVLKIMDFVPTIMMDLMLK